MVDVYTHIDLIFMVFMKVVLFMWQLVLFVKSTGKALNSQKHMKSEKHTWKVRITCWFQWKAHLKSEKHLKSGFHMKSIPVNWKHLKSERHMVDTQKVNKHHFVMKSISFSFMSFRVMVEFSCEFHLQWNHYEFHDKFQQEWNSQLNDTHSEILLISVKSCNEC